MTIRSGSRSPKICIGAIWTKARGAEQLNVSERSVRDAVKVRGHGTPGLVKAVEDGKIAVSVAAKLANLPAKTQTAAVADPGRAAYIFKQDRRAERETELGARLTALPERKFAVIYADPEWRFEPYSRNTGMDRAADNHYPTSDLADIKALDVQSIAADDCVLFLWATAPMLPEALAVMSVWGFEYRSHCAWAKGRAGDGGRSDVILLRLKDIFA